MPSSASRRAASLAVVALLLAPCALAGCRTGRSYPDPTGPRYAGAPTDARVPPPRDTLRVVTFNVEFAREIDGAARLLTTDPALRDADLVLLEEMNAPGARAIAERLGMWWVYYPAIHSTRARRDVGNAVLSRWPIVADEKVILPHRSRYAGTQRTATAATVVVGPDTLRVYAVHLGTPLDVGAGARRDQLRAVLAHAAPSARAIVGGDLNDATVGRVAREAGWRWPTERGPGTTRGLGRVDHIFLKGLASAAEPAAGTGPGARAVSDHRAVWARVALR